MLDPKVTFDIGKVKDSVTPHWNVRPFLVTPPISEQYGKEMLKIRHYFSRWQQDIQNVNFYLVSMVVQGKLICLTPSVFIILGNPKFYGIDGTLTPLGVEKLTEGLNYFHQAGCKFRPDINDRSSFIGITPKYR